MGPVVPSAAESITGSAVSAESVAAKEEPLLEVATSSSRKARPSATDAPALSTGDAVAVGATASVTPKEQAKVEESKEAKPQVESKRAPQVAGDEADEDEDVLLPEARPAFERNEVNAEMSKKFRENAVHVYGLDFLKTEHMNEIFGQFEHKYIEWINDASANIVFRSSGSAKRALESLSYPKVGDAPWRRTPDILVNDDCPPVFLQMRLATALDVKRSRKGVPAVQPQDTFQMQPRERRGFGAGPRRPYRDGISTELLEEAGMLGKRPSQGPLSEDEIAKRQKRVQRFAQPAPVVRLTPASELPPLTSADAATDPAAAAESGTAGAGQADVDAANEDVAAAEAPSAQSSTAPATSSKMVATQTGAVENDTLAAAVSGVPPQRFGAPALRQSAVEPTKEELARRHKRAERFSEALGTVGAVTATSGNGTVAAESLQIAQSPPG